MEKDFVQLNVRHILRDKQHGYGKVISDISPIQEIFNKWHVKNTGTKVRRVMQRRDNARIPLTTNAPFVYKKSAEDNHRRKINEDDTQGVRYIFQLSISG